MHSLWNKARASIAGAVRNTPVEVIIAVGLAALTSAVIADVEIGEREVVRVFLTAFLILCAVFATSASHALKVFDSRTRWILTGTFTAGIGAYGALILNVDLITEIWRWAFLAIAAAMGVMLVPVAARMGSVSASERFWRYNIRLFSRISVAWAYAFLLYAGLSVAIAAVDGLFDLSVSADVYGHLFAWTIIALGTILAVGGLSEVRRIGEPFAPETLVWGGRLGTFLFMPLVLIYLGIMYVYLAKVVTTGDIPSNILSPLALGAGMLGYFGLFVLQPHMQREDFRPLAAVLRAFPVAFVPIVPFGIWAVWQRVEQYGWTEFRYARMAALVCLGAFSLMGAYKWARKREFSLVTGPAVLGVVAILGAVGPWGASNVAESSQLRRLERSLRAAELLGPDGRMLPREAVAAKAIGTDAATIHETSEYLLESHGEAALAALSPVDLSEFTSVWDQLAALGVRDLDILPKSYSFYADQPFRFDRGGLTTDFSVSRYSDGDTRGVEVNIEDDGLSVAHDSRRGRASLVFERDKADGTDRRSINAEQMMRPIVNEAGKVIGQIGVRDVALEEHGETLRPTYASGILVLY